MLTLVDLAKFLDGVEVLNQPFGAVQTVGCTGSRTSTHALLSSPSHTHYLLVSRESRAVYLHPSTLFRRVGVPQLVQTEHFTRGRVQLVMVDLEGGERRVEGKFDVGSPGRILQRL